MYKTTETQYPNVTVNSHAVGMGVAYPSDFEIDFAKNPFSGSAA